MPPILYCLLPQLGWTWCLLNSSSANWNVVAFAMSVFDRDDNKVLGNAR